ncbi:sodium:proton antiporter [Labrys miyagiensis]|uniref:Sodium:proton antiporter n=1 Tax=Labrys miyagiensis TaxID=346912 RepID=A0ABQ6CCD4_9HYPH|nr:sodium:proton antiporter [Labrys miyagiensis]GLS17953.1 sodium:proton antiporter [Labrys miyagiensis]
MSTFDVAPIIFLFAALVSLANERFIKLPRSIALLLASLLVSLGIAAAGHIWPASWFPQAYQQRVEHANLPHTLLDGMLALLLFAATWHADIKGLRREGVLVFILATIGVLIATFVFAFGFWLLASLCGTPVPFPWCFLLGAILAPTDAVAVDELLKRVALPAGLRDIIAGESLFNDGAAVVMFLAAVALIGGQSGVIGNGRLMSALMIECAGGAAIGAVAGYAARLLVEHSEDEIVRLTLSIALALATYRIALQFHVSGPIAVVVAGLVMVNAGPRTSRQTAWRPHLATFWSLVDDLVNTLLFLLMGAEFFNLDFTAFTQAIVFAAIPLAILSRLVSIAIPIGLSRADWPKKARMISTLTWVGLRGAISIALVLTIPDGPYGPTLAAACYVVVIFTIVVQGLSTPAILSRIYKGEVPVPAGGHASDHDTVPEASGHAKPS